MPKKLKEVREPYASMTRAQLVDEIDRYAKNYNALEKAHDCLKAQKAAMQVIAEHGLKKGPNRFLKRILDIDCPFTGCH